MARQREILKNDVLNLNGKKYICSKSREKRKQRQTKQDGSVEIYITKSRHTRRQIQVHK